MWLILGICAVITSLLNWGVCLKGHDPKWFRFSSMSFTALTVCACYSAEADRAIRGDWAGLMDIMPGMSQALWACVVLSILVNGFTLFYKEK